MNLSWSDPDVRTSVKAVLVAVQRRMDGDDAAIRSRFDRTELADLVAVEVRRLRTDDDLPLSRGLAPDRRRAVWDTTLKAAMAELAGLGRLQPLLDDDNVQDIYVNAPDQVWIDRPDGTTVAADPVADNDDELIDLGRRITRHYAGAGGEQDWSQTNPVVDVVLPTGHRVSLMRTVSGRPTFSIRLPDLSIRRVSQLLANETMHPRVAELLSAAIRFGSNILVAGGTGAGKTCTMRTLLNELPPEMRKITIEDSQELFLTHPEMVDDSGQPLHTNIVEIVTRPPNAEGAGEFTLGDALRAAKRMNPTRLIVGEVRSVEAADMLDAMVGETGGSICTVHADSARTALDRVVALASEHSKLSESGAMHRVRHAIDIVVYQRRDASGRRYVTEVVEVESGLEDGVLRLNELFRVNATGQLTASGNLTPRLAQKLADNGWGGHLRAVD